MIDARCRRGAISFGVALAALLGFTQISSPALAETWILYTPIPTSTQSSVKALHRIAENIEKETNGELKIRIALGGSLQIQATDLSQAVADNVVQIGDDMYFSGSVPVAGILRLPGLVTNAAEARKTADVLQPYIEAAYAKLNTTVMSTVNYPPNIVFSRAKVTSIADLKGLKIRTVGPEQTELVKRFGALPLPLAFPEIAPALERGVVDGIVSSAQGVAWVMKDLLKYTFDLPIAYAQIINTVNTSALKKLSARNQEIVLRNFREGMAKAEPELQAEEAELQKKMSALGIQYTKATPAELKQLEDITKPYWEEWAKGQGPTVVEALGKVRAALGR